MTSRLYILAAAPFEGARQLENQPAGHQERRLHGHGFLARVRAALPADWAPFPCAETESLAERLREAVAPLDYTLLNETLPVPTDENLAYWVWRRLMLEVPGLETVGIQSTHDRDVDLDRDRQARDCRRFLLQPPDGPDPAARTQAALAYCLAHPQWRLSLQTHKIFNIP
jgi:6-pyruvoyltetrahydropterin/6-carboxytetrahydropterin synthase